MGSLHRGYDVPKDLLKKELEDRQVLLHSFGTAHLMENYATKVGRVSEQERTINKLCPKSGLGITKRMLVNRLTGMVNRLTTTTSTTSVAGQVEYGV